MKKVLSQFIGIQDKTIKITSARNKHVMSGCVGERIGGKDAPKGPGGNS